MRFGFIPEVPRRPRGCRRSAPLIGGLRAREEREHIIKKLGIELEYREEIDYGEDKGSFKTLSGYQHAELVKDYIEGKGSMAEIDQAHGFSNATVHNHTKSHNRVLETAGECPRCRRIDSAYSKVYAKRP